MDKVFADVLAFTLTGTPLGTWEDYAISFVSGSLKGWKIGAGLMTAYDVWCFSKQKHLEK